MLDYTPGTDLRYQLNLAAKEREARRLSILQPSIGSFGLVSKEKGRDLGYQFDYHLKGRHHFVLFGATKVPYSDIVKRTAKHFGVSVVDMKSERRSHTVIKPRHVAMYIAKQITGLSYPRIGYAMGCRDHTTAMYAVRKVAQDMKTDEKLAADVSAIMGSFGVVIDA